MWKRVLPMRHAHAHAKGLRKHGKLLKLLRRLKAPPMLAARERAYDPRPTGRSRSHRHFSGQQSRLAMLFLYL